MHFGEGSYSETEDTIKELLGTSATARSVPDLTPTGLNTPESYLGYDRLERYAGSPLQKDGEAIYTFPRALQPSEFAYAGRWRVERQRIVAGAGAQLRLHFIAQHVYLVLGGHGRVAVLVNGDRRQTVDVNSYRLYTLLNLPRAQNATLELRFTPGVQAYAFTFG